MIRTIRKYAGHGLELLRNVFWDLYKQMRSTRGDSKFCKMELKNILIDFEVKNFIKTVF